MKPIKADVRIEPVLIDNPERTNVFIEPKEDAIYRGMRCANDVLTCKKSKTTPLAQGLAGVLFAIAYWVLILCMSVQSSIYVSRSISAKDVTDIALKSQIDGNVICADARFEAVLTDNAMVNTNAF